MHQYKVSLHNGLDSFHTKDALGPVEAAHLWVNEYMPAKPCDIKVEGNGDGEMHLRVEVDTSYRYDLKSVAKEKSRDN